MLAAAAAAAADAAQRPGHQRQASTGRLLSRPSSTLVAVAIGYNGDTICYSYYICSSYSILLLGHCQKFWLKSCNLVSIKFLALVGLLPCWNRLTFQPLAMQFVMGKKFRFSFQIREGQGNTSPPPKKMSNEGTVIHHVLPKYGADSALVSAGQ